VVGPSCRDLINRGYLSDYRLIAPPSDIDISEVTIGATGDFSLPKLSQAIHRSKTIVGDVVHHYRKFADGKLGLTFAVDVAAAKEIAMAYRAAGIPAEVITADTPISVRGKLMRMFRARSILQLVSVETLGEGVDVPAVEVISMARHTASFQWYAQMFGRGLRIAEGKDCAIIIDHVQNYQRHGLPDVPRTYSLDRVEKRSRKKPDGVPLKNCLNPDCLQPYEAYLPACPYCGVKPTPGRRSSPEFVEGDLVELDPAVLAHLRGEIDRIDRAPAFPRGATPEVVGAIKKNHWERQQAQHKLRDAIALWAGWQKHLGRGDSESYRRFWYDFGVDVATAQTLGRAEAEDLMGRIQLTLDVNHVQKV
jgi:superfamily II DNA or RNA helicase